MRSKVRGGLVAAVDPVLVDELLDAYEEAKRNFYLGGHRLSAVEGGRLCEAAFRILQQTTTGRFEPLGTSLDAEKISRDLANLAPRSHPHSVRLYIPRALRVVYDIRNNRDAAHLADGIDPNVQDATLVVSILDWVLAEFVRLHHNVSPREAQEMIAGIVTRTVPVVEDFDGFLKVLNPNLPASDHCLVLLYQRGERSASYGDMETWSRPSMRANLRRTLHRLVHEKAYVHLANDTYRITLAGIREVERRSLLQ